MAQSPPPSVPPPAPPPPPPSPPGRSKPPAIAYLGAVGLLLLTALPQLFIGSEGLAYRIGRFLGGLFFSLLFAKFIWWLVRRSRKDLSPWSPWVFVIATGVSVLGLMGALSTAGREALQEQSTQSETSAEELYTGPGDSYFIEPTGLTYRELDAAAQQALQDQLASEPGAEEQTEDLAARQVVRGGKPVGAVIVFLMKPSPVSWEEAHANFRRGFEQSSDITLETTTIGGVDAAEGSGPEGEFIVLFDRNLIIQTFGFDRTTAETLAAAQAGAFD